MAFWDRVAPVYDAFETLYNGKAYRALGEAVAGELGPEDAVLECACGTGAISAALAPRCGTLTATDLSDAMLRQAAKKCRKFPNVTLQRADMTRLPFPDAQFDAVVAGNVIHLLEDPAAALRELARVCKAGGRLIVPTYISAPGGGNRRALRLMEALGAEFRRRFDLESYQRFFAELGYQNVTYRVVAGRMPCAVAAIRKEDAP